MQVGIFHQINCNLLIHFNYFACHLSIYFIKVLFATFIPTLKIHDYGILKNAFFPNSGWGYEGDMKNTSTHNVLIYVSI